MFLGIFNKWKKTLNKNHIQQSLTKEKFKELERLIGTSIKNRTYYIQALVHRSFLEENEEALATMFQVICHFSLYSHECTGL